MGIYFFVTDLPLANRNSHSYMGQQISLCSKILIYGEFWQVCGEKKVSYAQKIRFAVKKGSLMHNSQHPTKTDINHAPSKKKIY